MSSRDIQEDPRPVPIPSGNEFTRKLLKRVQQRQTLKDYLFMIVVGFKQMLKGFLKAETLKTLDNDQIDEQKKE